MSIVLIRHGETDLNAARVLQWPDTPLGERGRAQARALGARFAVAAPRPVLLVSSDMARARQTAAAIAATTGLPVRESPLLRERDFGELRGLPFDSLGFDPIEDERAPPGGESMAVFRARVAEAMDWLRTLRREADGDVLAVSHGLVIRVVLTEHASFPEGWTIPARLSNTSVSILAPERPHLAALVDCSRHLEGAARDDGRGVAGV
jgi:broad specificity phosphatase PhoE